MLLWLIFLVFEVLIERNMSAISIILNRPRKLNALSYQMISQLLELFLACENDSNVKLLIMKGKGRAFCSGGDVATVVRDSSKGNWQVGTEFFAKEYSLNYVMATYNKPQVSILNGIVMGGGVGSSIYGRFRVATENSVFAMPETTLGLFPDVGASYFLSRLPGFFGEYVGLTGAKLDGAEMLVCGLATHYVPSAKLSMLEEALYKVDSSDPDVVTAIIDQFSQKPKLKDKSPYFRLDVIDRCFSRQTAEEILYALENDVNTVDDWIWEAVSSLKTASPTSLKITLRSIREGRFQCLGQCLIREYRMASHAIRGDVSKDFHEGCRATLIDKDKNPKWEPSKLDLVSDAMVDGYFSKVDDEKWQDLKIPVRPTLPAYAVAKL